MNKDHVSDRREAIVNELAQLYMLRDEGKNVEKTIERLEDQLCETCDDEVDALVQKKTKPKTKKI